MPSHISSYVSDILDAAGLNVRKSGSGVEILDGDDVVGAGASPAEAAMAVFKNHPQVAAKNAQALHFAAALSYGHEELFEAINELWGEEEEEEEEEE